MYKAPGDGSGAALLNAVKFHGPNFNPRGVVSLLDIAARLVRTQKAFGSAGGAAGGDGAGGVAAAATATAVLVGDGGDAMVAVLRQAAERLDPVMSAEEKEAFRVADARLRRARGEGGGGSGGGGGGGGGLIQDKLAARRAARALGSGGSPGVGGGSGLIQDNLAARRAARALGSGDSPGDGGGGGLIKDKLAARRAARAEMPAQAGRGGGGHERGGDGDGGGDGGSGGVEDLEEQPKLVPPPEPVQETLDPDLTVENKAAEGGGGLGWMEFFGFVRKPKS